MDDINPYLVGNPTDLTYLRNLVAVAPDGAASFLVVTLDRSGPITALDDIVAIDFNPTA